MPGLWEPPACWWKILQPVRYSTTLPFLRHDLSWKELLPHVRPSPQTLTLNPPRQVSPGGRVCPPIFEENSRPSPRLVCAEDLWLACPSRLVRLPRIWDQSWTCRG